MNKVKDKFKTVISKVKNKLNRIKKDHLIRKYFSTNKLFIIFVLTCVINSTILRFFCMHTLDNYLSIKAILADLCIVILVGSFSYLFKPKHRFIYLLIVDILLSAICMINSVYYTFYTSFASVSMLSLTQYIGDVGDAVVENVLQLKDLIYALGPIILTIFYIKLRKKDNNKKTETKKYRKKMFFKTIAAAFLVFILFCINLTSKDVTRFIKQWNKEYIVTSFGIYIYQVNDLVSSVQPKINSMFGYDKAKSEYQDYFKDRRDTNKENEYSNIFDGKNVIVIHGESIMTNVIGLSFNGKEVTPTLNKLVNEGLFFSNFHSQVSVGTSSDTELTYNTSLMPTKSGTAFVSYSDRYYNAIPKFLTKKGYYTFSMHANNADFWNRRNMHKSLGYDKFYAKDSYTVNSDNIIGLGLSDQSFFEQSIPKIKKISEENEKFYGLLITLTNHTPFSNTDKYGEYSVDMKEVKTNEDGTTEEVTYPYMENTKLGNYFKSVYYADKCLGEFLEQLDSEGLLDNTVFVLYGDHDARLPRSDYERLYNYDKENNSILPKEDENYKEYDYYQYELGRKVPFIIWTKESKDNSLLNKEVKDVMGMYDVLPTLGNMLGFYYKNSLGHDIFDIKENNIVVFPNGNWVTNKVYYNSQKGEYYSFEGTTITEDEITNNTEYTNKLLDISYNTILFDLEKEGEKNEIN